MLLVFVDHWMHHKTDYKVFDQYAEQIEKEIQMMSMIHPHPVEKFLTPKSFLLLIERS